MDQVEIVGAAQSPFVWAMRIAAVEKGVPFASVHALAHTPEILAGNPFGKVPVMRHRGLELGETRAIALYFDRAFEGPPLTPTDLVGAARAEQWVMHVHTEIAPLWLWRYTVQYIFPSGPDGAPNRAVIDAAVPDLRKQMETLDHELGARAFLAGEGYSLADVFFTPILHYTLAWPEAAALFAAAPNLQLYYERVKSRASFAATLPPPLPTRAAAA